MFRIILVLSSLLYFTNVSSQTFEKIIKSSHDIMIYDGKLQNNDYVVFPYNIGNSQTYTYSSKIVRMNWKTGQITDSVNIEPTLPGFFFNGLYDFHLTLDSIFIGTGIFFGNSLNYSQQYIIHLDQELNILFDTIVDVDQFNERLLKTIINDDEVLVTIGSDIDSGHIILLERELDGSFIRYKKYYHHPTTNLANAIVDIPQTNKYHYFMYLGSDHAYDIIDKFDLSVDTTLTYPLHFRPIEANMDSFDTSTYYVAGKQWGGFPINNDLSFLKCDTDGNYQQFVYETDSNAFYTYKCLVSTENYLYFAGVYPWSDDPPSFFYPEQRYIHFFKLNKMGEIVWQKFYKGEVNYAVIKILATPDQGALIYSLKYDWNDPIPYQRDLHILKIDSSGYYTPMTGIPDWEECLNNQILVYPNPANDIVNFVFGLYTDLEISIYNMTGKLVHKSNSYHSISIDLSSFNRGLYIYRITGKNEFYEEGKLILE